eukprot:maker-scaffold_52-snap-gene-0.3-mRNA-1 protein AED:0.00 eAED:0.00 QI:244/1/1/1/1/1/2/143/652
MSDLDHAALVAEEVIEGLKSIYSRCILPLEKAYKYDVFFDPPMQDIDFESKPMILILGQYSVGKTSFIRHLIGRDFPGSRIGPEPTTDKFVAVFHGVEDQVIPGQVLQTNPALPFRGLGKFSNNFLNKFEGSVCASNALKSFMFVDTPGVLSGKKQRNRQYPYEQVVQWFAERASRIIVMFDSNKLDISDEFKAVIGELRRHDEKMRVVLNKSDKIQTKELIRVYGALMWALGKVFKTPEVLRVYLSSFGSKAIDKNHEMYQIFRGDAADLIGELKALPRQSAMTKINNLLKRARLVKVHAQIVSKLRGELPKFFGKQAKQRQIIDQLPDHFRKIARDIGVPPSDFPNLKRFKDVLMEEQISSYPKYNPRLFNILNIALEKSIPQLVGTLNERNDRKRSKDDNINPFEKKAELGDEFDTYSQNQSRKVSVAQVLGGVGNALGNRIKEGKQKMKEMNDKHGRTRVERSTRTMDQADELIVDEDLTTASQYVPQAKVRPSPSVKSSKTHKARLVSLAPSDNSLEKVERVKPVEKRQVFLSDEDGGIVSPIPQDGESEDWVVSLVDKRESDNLFFKQKLIGGKLTGKAARKAFAGTGLPNHKLNDIWVLVDFSKNNELDADQFALAMYLCRKVKQGEEIPQKLTYRMIPPSHREL